MENEKRYKQRILKMNSYIIPTTPKRLSYKPDFFVPYTQTVGVVKTAIVFGPGGPVETTYTVK